MWIIQYTDISIMSKSLFSIKRVILINYPFIEFHMAGEEMGIRRLLIRH